MVIPFFKSHYSINRSILTLDEDHDGENGPRSIIKLIKENGIKNSFLIDDNLSGFLEAYTNAEKEKVGLNFGVRMTVCDNMKKKNAESLKTEHKIIVFLKNSSGYDRLFEIYSEAATNGFYYIPRIDLKTLTSMWKEESLSLGIPYYDSFLFNNCMRLNTIAADLKDFPVSPTFIFEKNDLFFEANYSKFLMNFLKVEGLEKNIIRAKSIYYKNKDDFLAYLTMRCIGKKSSIQKPNLEFMSSDEFSLESFLNLGGAENGRQSN